MVGSRCCLPTGKNGDEPPLKDFGHELIPSLVREGVACEFRFEGYWRDVGTVESYWQGHMDLLEPEPGLVLDDPDWPILTYGTQRLPARIEGSARIAASLIAPGCRIAGRVERSVLAPGVVVEEGAEVRDSILLHGTVVGKSASVVRAVLDADVRVGEGAAVGEEAGELALAGQRARIAEGDRVLAGGRVSA
jgi:glucose-1-phosphate adenylyltransferase